MTNTFFSKTILTNDRTTANTENVVSLYVIPLKTGLFLIQFFMMIWILFCQFTYITTVMCLPHTINS